ncbi:DUF6049 family protein [Boudabousia tangfeifanii]|nr:DUF6049 family protein [Boudabousia tangfeifanii]
MAPTGLANAATPPQGGMASQPSTSAFRSLASSAPTTHTLGQTVDSLLPVAKDDRTKPQQISLNFLGLNPRLLSGSQDLEVTLEVKNETGQFAPAPRLNLWLETTPITFETEELKDWAKSLASKHQSPEVDGKVLRLEAIRLPAMFPGTKGKVTIRVPKKEWQKKLKRNGGYRLHASLRISTISNVSSSAKAAQAAVLGFRKGEGVKPAVLGTRGDGWTYTPVGNVDANITKDTAQQAVDQSASDSTVLAITNQTPPSELTNSEQKTWRAAKGKIQIVPFTEITLSNLDLLNDIPALAAVKRLPDQIRTATKAGVNLSVDPAVIKYATKQAPSPELAAAISKTKLVSNPDLFTQVPTSPILPKVDTAETPKLDGSGSDIANPSPRTPESDSGADNKPLPSSTTPETNSKQTPKPTGKPPATKGTKEPKPTPSGRTPSRPSTAEQPQEIDPLLQATQRQQDQIATSLPALAAVPNGKLAFNIFGRPPLTKLPLKEPQMQALADHAWSEQASVIKEFNTLKLSTSATTANSGASNNKEKGKALSVFTPHAGWGTKLADLPDSFKDSLALVNSVDLLAEPEKAQTVEADSDSQDEKNESLNRENYPVGRFTLAIPNQTPVAALTVDHTVSELTSLAFRAKGEARFDYQQVLLAALAELGPRGPIGIKIPTELTNDAMNALLRGTNQQIQSLTFQQALEAEPSFTGSLRTQSWPSTDSEAQVTTLPVDELTDDLKRLNLVSQMLDNPRVMMDPIFDSALLWLRTTDPTPKNYLTWAKELPAYLAPLEAFPPNNPLMITSESSLPLPVKNKLPWNLNFQVSLIANNLRLKVKEPLKSSLPPNTSRTLNVPLTAMGPGDVKTRVILLNPAGDQVNEPTRFTLRIRPDWETKGLLTVSIVLGILMIIGLVRRIRRGK